MGVLYHLRGAFVLLVSTNVGNARAFRMWNERQTGSTFFYVYMSNKTDINIPLGAKWLKYVKYLAYETIVFTYFRFYLLARSGAGKKLFLCDCTGG